MKKIKGSVPKYSLVTLYKTLVEPYLRPIIIIWGQYGNTLIEKVRRLQNKAARIISGTSFEETNHDNLLRELNWMNVKQLISHDLAVAMLLCLILFIPDFYSWYSTGRGGGGGVFHLHPVTPLRFKSDDSNFVQN